MDEDEDLARLQKEFCPPIDVPVVFAIYKDYEGQPNAFEQAHAILSIFKDDTVVEQLTEFDPSGCSTQNGVLPELEGAASPGHKSPTETDATSLTNGVSSLALSSSGVSTPSESSANMLWLSNLDISAKEGQLMETFPTLPANTITYVLKKNKGDYMRATDELLNHVLFEEMDGQDGEEKILRKGIDNFAEDESVPRGRKTKTRKNKKRTNYINLEEYARASSEPTAPAQNKWHTASQDVDFIASKVNISHKAVKSLYHERGGSVRSTIAALIESSIKNDQKSIEEESDVVVQNVADLSNEFPLDIPQAHALIRLTQPSSADAHELAKALTRSSSGSPTTAVGGIELIPRYAPLNISEPDDTDLPGAALSSPGPGPQTAATFAAARHGAFTKASEYHRKGKSDPLMKAAAGYYGQLGRDQHRAYQSAVAVEADRLVARQSTDTQLDLHGVSVADAKRIAKQKVGEWWAALGEERIREYAGGRGRKEYRIITGVGRHSDGGRAKIGPAVVKMLVGDGWKVEVESGVVTVVGLRKA